MEQAVVEAAVVVNAAAARRHGTPPAPGLVPAGLIGAGASDDLRSEVVRLVLVSRVIRDCPIVRELSLRARLSMWPLPRHHWPVHQEHGR